MANNNIPNVNTYEIDRGLLKKLRKRCIRRAKLLIVLLISYLCATNVITMSQDWFAEIKRMIEAIQSFEIKDAASLE
ncbi:MAG: hypothetical protein WBO44_02380, partial [Saprospiraceae bacterium]